MEPLTCLILTITPTAEWKVIDTPVLWGTAWWIFQDMVSTKGYRSPYSTLCVGTERCFPDQSTHARSHGLTRLPEARIFQMV
jgi:hypothetical protein